MIAKIINFKDISSNYNRVNYKAISTGETTLIIKSKYGIYVKVWDKYYEPQEIRFYSSQGYIFKNPEEKIKITNFDFCPEELLDTDIKLKFDGSLEDITKAKSLGYRIEYAFGRIFYVEPER